MKRLWTLPFIFFLFPLFVQSQPDTITIVGVGDVMLGTTFPKKLLPPKDGRKLLEPVTPYLKEADLTFGNYEGTLFDGEGLPKKCADSLNCYAFKTPERYALHLKNAGFSVMSVANNHSGDFGPEGRRRTMDVLRAAGIEACGTEEQPYTVVEKGGVRYGLAAFAPNTGTPNINDYKQARKIVRYLDSLCDIVVVSFHGGAEGLKRQHVPRENEWFLGENRGNVHRFARVVIDAGADIVFGHGPHVARAVDLYKDRFIVYSLGNFATYGRFNLKKEAGIAPIVKVAVSPEGRFLSAAIIPIRQAGEGGPKLDSTRAVIRKMKQLTVQDFPDSSLFIHADGQIRKKVKKKQNGKDEKR